MMKMMKKTIHLKWRYIVPNSNNHIRNINENSNIDQEEKFQNMRELLDEDIKQKACVYNLDIGRVIWNNNDFAH